MRGVFRRWLGLSAALWLSCAALVALGAWHAVVAPVVPLQRLEWISDDLRTQALAHAAGPHADIVIIDIDEASLRDVGRWPWARERIAALVRELFENQHIAALGFDQIFSEPDWGAYAGLQALAAADPLLAARLPAWRAALDGDHILAQALQDRPAVLGWYLTADRGGARAGALPAPVAQAPAGVEIKGLPSWTGFAANQAVLTQAAPRAGFFNALADDDGVVRSVAALAVVDGGVHQALALALWRCATGEPDLSVDWRPVPGQTATVELARLRYGAASTVAQLRIIQPDEHGALRVPFRGAGGPQGGSFRYISAAALLQHQLPPGSLAGQVALLGTSAPGLADLRATPIHPALPGVEVHAHLLAGLLDGNLPERPAWAPGYEAVLIGLLAVLATAFVTRLPAPGALAAMALTAGAVVAGTLYAQSRAQLTLPMAAALLLSGALFVAGIGANSLREWRERRSLVNLFGRYLPPERVRALLREPDALDLEAHNRELTLMFCDLQGFSGLAEKLPPLALRDLLNDFFSQSSAIVHAHGGTLDKFIGDAVMAFWGAPQPQTDHAARAVRAAMDLAAAAAPLAAQLARDGLPGVRYGIGLATGLVCVGDLGSRLRRTYTAVGDAVNLASRLEALTRDTGVNLLVAQTTRDACASQMPDVLWLEVDETRVRGRDQPVKIFTPVVTNFYQNPQSGELIRTWHLALSAACLHDDSLARAHLARLNTLLATATPPDAAPPVMADPACDGPAVLARLVKRLAERLAERLARRLTQPQAAVAAAAGPPPCAPAARSGA